MIDILSPANIGRRSGARPKDTRSPVGSDTYFRNCTGPGQNDGTILQAEDLNSLLCNLRRAARALLTPAEIDAEMQRVPASDDDFNGDRLLTLCFQKLQSATTAVPGTPLGGV